MVLVVLGLLVAVIWQLAEDPSAPANPTPSPGAANPAQPVPDPAATPDSDRGGLKPAPIPDREPATGILAELPDLKQVPADLDDKAQTDWVDQHLSVVDEAAYEDDKDSLLMLVSETRNPHPDISRAARESLMARHAKAAVPYLQELLKKSTGADEQVKLMQLIEFLNSEPLPFPER